MATTAHFGKYPHHNGGTQRCDIWEDEGDITTFRSILHFWISPAVQIKKGPTKKDNAENLVKFFSDVATPRQPKPQSDFFSTSEIKRKETRTKENGNKERGPETLDGTDNFKFKPAFVSDLEEAKNTRPRRGRTLRTVAAADDTASPLRLNESSVPGGRVLPVVAHSNPSRAAVSASTTATFQCWQGWDTFKGNSGQVSCDKKSSVRDWQLGGVSSLQTQTGTDTPKPRTVVVVEDPADDTHFRTVTDSRNSTGARNWENSSDKGKRHESESINRGDADRDFDHRTVSPVSCRVLSGVTGPAAVTALSTVTTTPDAVAASLYTDTYFPAGSNNSFDAQPKLTGISSRSVQLQQFHSQPEGSNFLSQSNTHISQVHRDSAYALSIDTDQYSSLNGGTSTSVAVSPNGTVHVGCVRVVIEPIEKKADFKQPPCGILPVVRQRKFSFEADTKLEQNSDSERQSQSCAALHANSPGKDSLASVSRFKSVLVKEQRKVVDFGLVSLEHNSDSALTATCLKDSRLPHARDNAQVSVKGGHFLSSSGRVRAESSQVSVKGGHFLSSSGRVRAESSQVSVKGGHFLSSSGRVRAESSQVSVKGGHFLSSSGRVRAESSQVSVKGGHFLSSSGRVRAESSQVSVKGGHFLSSSGRVRAESSPAPCQTNSSLQDSEHTNHSSVVKGVKEDLFHSQCVQIELASFTGVRHQSSRSNGAVKGVRHQPVYSESAHIEPSSFKGVRYQPVHSSSMIPMEVSETVAIVKLPNYAEHSFESAVHYSDMRRHKSTVNFEPVLAPVRFADTMYLWGKDTTKKRYVSRTFYEPRVKPKRFGETDFIFPKGKTERFASFVDFHIDECRKWFKTCVELKARTFTTVHSFPESSTVTSSSVTSPGLRRDVTVNGGDGGGLPDGPGASQVFIPPHKVGSKGLGEKHFRVALDKEKVDVNMNGPISNGL